MKNKWMITLIVMLGVLPFVIGGIQNWYMLNYMDSVFPYGLIAVFFLLIWGCIAFFLNRICQKTRIVVIFLNLIAMLDLLLIGIQELILHAYWMNGIGVWSQFFYLPVIKLGFSLTKWTPRVFAAYAVSFVLMITASFAGCKLRDKLKK